MLKSTVHLITKEQFRKLRDARRLIEQQFDSELSLQSESVLQNLYAFALRSQSNDLFDLFEELQKISDNSVAQPLTKEQFIILREARGRIELEFKQELPLLSANVMDLLYEFSLQSSNENLFDLFTYLNSRPDRPVQPEGTEQDGAEKSNQKFDGVRFRKLREARRLIKERFNDDLVLQSDGVLDTLYTFARRSDQVALLDIADFLKSWTPSARGTFEINFAALSAEDFDRLRQAQNEITQEFDEAFSLHSETALEDLYSYALLSEGDSLFDLFVDLLSSQPNGKKQKDTQWRWLSKDQFKLLRSARALIRSEFDATLMLQSDSVYDDLYGFALRSEKEELFDLCAALHAQRQSRTGPSNVSKSGKRADLPRLSKEHFMMLRRARALIGEEFSEELRLQSDVVLADLYKFAVRSQADELFDLHSELAALEPAATGTLPTETTRLSKEEFVVLRGAKGLIEAEFKKELALDAEDVLDRLYEFALESEGEELFDLHATLNDMATNTDAPTDVADAPTEVIEKLVDSEPKTTIKRIMSLFNSRSEEQSLRETSGSRAEPQTAKASTLAMPLPNKTMADSREKSIAGASPPAQEAPLTRPPTKQQVTSTVTTQSASTRPTTSARDPGGMIERAISLKSRLASVSEGGGADIQADDDPIPVLGIDVTLEEESPSPASRKIRKRRTLLKAARSPGTLSASGGSTADALSEEFDHHDGRNAEDASAAAESEVMNRRARLLRSNLEQLRGVERSVAPVPDAVAGPGSASVADSVGVARTWHLNSLDRSFGVRLLKQLRIELLDGEVLLGAMSGAPLCAAIDIVDEKPVLTVKDAIVLVNGDPITDSCKLASGDRIQIEKSILVIEFI